MSVFPPRPDQTAVVVDLPRAEHVVSHPRSVPLLLVQLTVLHPPRQANQVQQNTVNGEPMFKKPFTNWRVWSGQTKYDAECRVFVHLVAVLRSEPNKHNMSELFLF